MSQRETQTKSVVYPAIGGVNQRVHGTELKSSEYENLDSVFPEFAGLQSKIWGKRVLNKYNNAVYGIYQFWTPQGYGVGLYSFDGTISTGPWITPTSHFPGIDDLPPAIDFDENQLTLDELGNSFGWGFSSEASANIDPSNGGPAGQGEKTPDVSFVPSADFTLRFVTLFRDFGCIGQGLSFRFWEDVIYFHDIGDSIVDILRAGDLTEGQTVVWHGVRVKRGPTEALGIFNSPTCQFPFPPPPSGFTDGFLNTTGQEYHIHTLTCAGRDPVTFSIKGFLISNGKAPFCVSVNGRKYILPAQGGSAANPAPIDLAITVTAPPTFSYGMSLGTQYFKVGAANCNEALIAGSTSVDIGTVTYTGPFV